MSITAVSICGRAETGDSRPFFCEADDGYFYFLKRDDIGPDRVVIEYVVSRLAEQCGLPVAPVAVVEVPELLARHAVLEAGESLGAGPFFGSRRIPFADDLRSGHLREIDEETKMRCLCFDWWVRNPARRLDRIGGDPNALWDPRGRRMALVDHDGCLDPAFDGEAFVREHAFRDARPFLEREPFRKWRTRFESAIYDLDKIWEEMPSPWVEDESGASRLSFTREEVEARLIKPEQAPDGILPR